MRTSAVCDLPGDRRNEHADRTDNAEQAGDFGAEVVSGVELQRQDRPEARNEPNRQPWMMVARRNSGTSRQRRARDLRRAP
jgi:hypothetical protein